MFFIKSNFFLQRRLILQKVYRLLDKYARNTFVVNFGYKAKDCTAIISILS